MKNLNKALTAVVALLMASSTAFAATVSSPSYPVSAVVDGSLSLTVTLRRNSTAGATTTTMNFGQLQELTVGSLRSSVTGPGNTGTGSIVASVVANSHGLPYTITQTGTALSNGNVNLPAGACTVVPVYATQDNAGAAKPAAAVLGSAGTWVATNKALYTSEAGAAAMRAIQAHYSITDDPAAGSTAAVPSSQAGGTYNGTVTFTVTA
jgi:hypothetical protein